MSAYKTVNDMNQKVITDLKKELSTDRAADLLPVVRDLKTKSESLREELSNAARNLDLMANELKKAKITIKYLERHKASSFSAEQIIALLEALDQRYDRVD